MDTEGGGWSQETVREGVESGDSEGRWADWHDGMAPPQAPAPDVAQ